MQWVGRQRSLFKEHREGRPTTLTQDRMDRLAELDFVWCAAFSSIHPNSATEAAAGGPLPVLPSVPAAGSDSDGCAQVPVAAEGTTEAKNDNMAKDVTADI